MDELYVVARRVLLDALEALGPHREAVIVVGAQAIYLRAGEADLVVAPYTTDGDLALDPDLLAEIPPLEDALLDAAFVPGGRDAVGVWFTRRDTPTVPDVQVQVDLLVAEAVSPGRGRRAARLPGHEPTAARIVRGLEGVLVDLDVLPLRALDPADTRSIDVKVAGPAGLLVAKLHKIDERKGSTRANDKDALDVFRILRGVTEELAERVRRVLGDSRSKEAGARAMVLLGELSGRGGEGAERAARAVAGVMDAAEVRTACEVLVGDLEAALQRPLAATAQPASAPPQMSRNSRSSAEVRASIFSSSHTRSPLTNGSMMSRRVIDSVPYTAIPFFRPSLLKKLRSRALASMGTFVDVAAR